MSLFNRSTAPAPLVDQLAAKADELLSRSASESLNAESLFDAAHKAQLRSESARNRASVVTEAVAILGDAADVD